MKNLSTWQWFAIAVTVILTSYQLVRMIAFIDVYGGIEHDGGWMLTISRSLAEQGTYTTLVSVLADPNAPAGVGVDDKFDIQAEDGRVWFFTGNGIGPSSIIPDALVLWLFGTGFWALRAGPLIFYTLFLLLSALILYRLAGLGAIVLFHVYLFVYPNISIFLGYEAMGEVPAMFYVLWSYLALAAALRASSQPEAKRVWLWFLGAGLVVGLTLNAKIITLWSISGVFIWAGVLWLIALWRRSRDEQVHRLVTLPHLVWLSVGAALPILLWEAVHYVTLTRLTSVELYLQHAEQRLRFILDDGSGVGLQIHEGATFFWDKFFILGEVASTERWLTAIIFGVILLGGAGLLWLWRSDEDRQNLLAPIWIGWLANTVWFVSLAKTGWPRHFWFGLVLAMLILSVLVVIAFKQAWQAERLRAPLLAGASALLILIGIGFAQQPHVWGFFLPDAIVTHWQQQQIENRYGASLPWIIIPKAQQMAAVEYIAQLPPEANVYYPGGHKSAEIPALTGRIQYPLARRAAMTPHPADVVLIGPSLISPWKDPTTRRDLVNLVEQQCPNPALQNEYYMLCPIETNLVQQ